MKSLSVLFLYVSLHIVSWSQSGTAISSLSQLSGPQISGTISGFSKKWRPFLYVAKWESLEDLNTDKEAFLIATIPLDSSGKFSFSSRILNNELTFYRLHVLPIDTNISGMISEQPVNYVVLL